MNAIAILLVIVAAQCLTIQELTRNSYNVFDSVRNDKGMYRDSRLFEGTEYHPASTAGIGMAMIAVCIADGLGYIDNGTDLILQTMRSLLNKTEGFIPDFNECGYYRHFLYMNNGSRAWNSEYSTIDTALLYAGALFSKLYFTKSTEIAALVDEMTNLIDWTAAVKGDGTSNELYMVMNTDGSCQGQGGDDSTLHSFNEYQLVAWYAYQMDVARNISSKSTTLWNNFWSNPTTIPKLEYAGYEVLFDDHFSFLSSFVIQFAYFHVPYFVNNAEFMRYFKNEMDADYEWFQQNVERGTEQWGLGAGVQNDGYSANSINNNPFKIVSPHIMAGAMNVSNHSLSSLQYLLDNNLGIYTLPDNKSQILWRYSLTDPKWKADCVQLIDYSTMMFGLAIMDDNCGVDFFQTHVCKYKQKKIFNIAMIIVLSVLTIVVVVLIFVFSLKKSKVPPTAAADTLIG